MKPSISVLAAGLALTLAGPAGAERYKLHYAARIATITRGVPSGPPLDSADIKGHVIVRGDTVTGDFTFDAADPPISHYEYESFAAATYGGNAATTSVVRFGNSTLSETGSRNESLISVDDSSDRRYRHDDLLFTSTTNGASQAYTAYVELYFIDKTAAALEGTGLPIKLPDQMAGAFGYRYSRLVNGTYDDILMRGELTSAVISAVPEPGTGTLLLLGLGTLGWRALARRKGCR